jgi:hypothetical protein
MNRIIFILILFIIESCDTKMNFIYLDLHSVKYTKENSKYSNRFDDEPKGNKIDEYILVKNIPSEKLKLKEMMISYFDSLKTVEHDTLISERTAYFYKYSSDTKAFITSKRDYDGFSRVYIDDRVDDYLGSIVYRKYFDDDKEYTIISTGQEIDTLKLNKLQQPR